MRVLSAASRLSARRPDASARVRALRPASYILVRDASSHVCLRPDNERLTGLRVTRPPPPPGKRCVPWGRAPLSGLFVNKALFAASFLLRRPLSVPLLPSQGSACTHGALWPQEPPGWALLS